MSIQCKFFVTNYLWTENLLLHWNFFWNEISTCSLQSDFKEMKLHVVLMSFFDAILMDKKSAQLQHTFLFYFLKEKDIIVVLISLFDMFLTILKMKVVWISLLNIFLFLLHFYHFLFITKYLGLGRYTKTWTTKERMKCNNVRVFLNVWVLDPRKKRQLLRMLICMRFMCCYFSNNQIDEQI